MVGRRVARPVRHDTVPGEVVLEARGVSAGGRLHEIDLTLRAGEVLGVIGVSGNGQAALVQLLSGLLRTSAGTLALDGAPYPQGDVRAVVEAGIGRIPEDRGAEGTIAEMTVWGERRPRARLRAALLSPRAHRRRGRARLRGPPRRRVRRARRRARPADRPPFRR